MDYDITHRPAYSLLRVQLDRGESVTAEPGAMVAHSAGIEISTGTGDSGLLSSAKAAVMGGEDVMRNTFTADRAGHVTLAAPLPGDIVTVDLDDGDIQAQQGAYIAAGPDVDLDASVGGLGTLLAEGDLSVLELRGRGPAFLSAFGGVETVTVEPGEPYTIDNGHLVAWDETLEFETTRVGGLKSTVFSDEGLVCEFTGSGRVWYQTRNYEDFVGQLAGDLPTGGGGGGGGGGVDVDVGGGEDEFEEAGFEEGGEFEEEF
jgi:uncharacterized protein (TIGR00266 family)